MVEPFALIPLPDAPPPTKSKRYAAVGAVIVLVLVASIGAAVIKHSQQTNGSAALVRAASTKTKAAGTSKFTATVAVSSGGNQITSITMDGATDYANALASMTINAAGSNAEIRLVGGLEYFHIDGANLPDGKQWVEIDPSALGLPANAGAPSDPASQLQYLERLTGDATDVGKEDIDGVATTHYRVTLDFTKVLDQLAQGGKGLGSDAMTKGLELLKGSVDLSHIPAEVWLDDGGLVRQFTVSLHLPTPVGTVDEVTTMKFSDFGAPVAVEAPPADQVAPFTDVPDFFKHLVTH